MLEPPDIADDTIVAAVRTDYGLPVGALTFLPLGCDSAAWAYRAVTNDGAVHFVKLRKGSVKEAALLVPRYLHDRGVSQVIPPIPTLEGALWSRVGGFSCTLYPFVEGSTGTDRGLDERHWLTYGAVLRQIHDLALPADLTRQMNRETFVPSWAGRLERLEAQIGARTTDESIATELAAFWSERRPEIRALAERTGTLGRRLRATQPPLVLCHADIHTWNILIDTADRFWIVDWDETVLAPRERDLMFVIGGLGAGLVEPHEEGWFLTGYGATSIDPLALAYYRHDRAVDELCAFSESVLLMPEVGEITRRDALEGVLRLFAPGNIVSLAYEADRAL